MVKNDESNSEQEQQKEKRQFNQEQYDMLLRCSKKNDVTEWNQWRKEHHDEKILLCGANLKDARLNEANLKGASLRGVNLEGASLKGVNLEGAFFGDYFQNYPLHRANLKGAKLYKASLKYAYLGRTNLEGANLVMADLEDARLRDADLEEADLQHANLKGGNLREAKLKGANLSFANLDGADLQEANLEGTHLRLTSLDGADLREANLEGAILWAANIMGANFEMAIVNGYTLIDPDEIDQFTNFTGVGLNNVRINPSTKQLLEYNIRRSKWEFWYRRYSNKKWKTWIRKAVTFPIRIFWWISNYGLSTWRIIFTFFILSIVFATFYFVWGAVDYFCLGIKDHPGIVNNLFMPITAENMMSDVYYGAMTYLRSVYFSVVTMTTLGFGDANTSRTGLRWFMGHLTLLVQVVLGYVLLGAIVTRFAVLFTAGGPAGKLMKSKKTKAR